MKTSLLIASAVAACVALPLSAGKSFADDPEFKAEKCYGVNALGKNDCASSAGNSCAGEAERASDPLAWIYVPVGTCQKIAGGSLDPKKG
ncbi:MAG TPA: DUF2282 domain-containing protein [Stellaceae bacterium]|nr:DUF2282 domain-containing protein [Stellaceae bacterium]